MYDKSQDILENIDDKNFSEVRHQERREVQKLNEELRETTSNMIQKSGYYSRMDYYNSLGDSE